MKPVKNFFVRNRKGKKEKQLPLVATIRLSSACPQRKVRDRGGGVLEAVREGYFLVNLRREVAVSGASAR